MFEMTHQEARALLHAAADQRIDPDELILLDTHLSGCESCAGYAKSLENLETILRKGMRAKWDFQKPNLSIQAITHPNPARMIWNNFMRQPHAFEKIGVVAFLLVGYFLIANLVGIQSPIEKETATPLPTPNGLVDVLSNSPTPSVKSSVTKSIPENCETLNYVVLTNDTLESIAFQHGTTKEVLQELNNLTSNTVFNGMELVVPVCQSTPSHTATISRNTLTITPLSGTLFPTQPE